MSRFKEKLGGFAAKIKGAGTGYDVAMEALEEQNIVDGIVKFHDAMNKLDQKEIAKTKFEASKLGVSEEFFRLLDVPATEIRALAEMSLGAIDRVQHNLEDRPFNETKASRGKRIAAASSFAAAIYGSLHGTGIEVSDLVVASKNPDNQATNFVVGNLTKAFADRFTNPESFKGEKEKNDPLHAYAVFEKFVGVKNEKGTETLTIKADDPDAFRALSASASNKVDRLLATEDEQTHKPYGNLIKEEIERSRETQQFKTAKADLAGPGRGQAI